jgi:hypothetical protein
MDIEKSYAIDYQKFKNRYVDSGLGDDMQAQNKWRHLIGSNLFDKKDALSDLKEKKFQLKDLKTLGKLVRSSIMLKKRKGKESDEK